MKFSKKQQTAFSIIVFLLWMATACATRGIHPGAINKTDSDLYDGFLIAQATLNQAKVDFAAGKIPASAKDEINTAIRAYNVAQETWKAWRSGASKDYAQLEKDISALTREVAKVIRLRGDK